MSEEEQLATLRSNLNLIKSMEGDKAQDEFYALMEKAKKAYGEESIYMGQFYFEYAKFIIDKLEKNIDVFNASQLPKQQMEEVAEQQQDEEDDSSAEQVNKNNNNSQNEKEENNNQPIITEQENNAQNKNEKVQVAQQNNEQAQNTGENNEGGEQDDDDFEVCAANLICAIKIFQSEKQRLSNPQEGKKLYTLDEVSRYISKCRSRLGDLYQLNQNYLDAIDTYNMVVVEEQKREGHDKNRGLAEIHYMIGNSHLYENKENCENIAITEFIKAVTILLNHMKSLSSNDQTLYEIPTLQQTKVDRFSYLPKPTDTDQTKQIKQVISCLLDKIQDTHQQISIRKQYEELKQKKPEEQQNKFSEIKQDKPAVNLGTFGNRKRKPEKEQ